MCLGGSTEVRKYSLSQHLDTGQAEIQYSYGNPNQLLKQYNSFNTFLLLSIPATSFTDASHQKSSKS